MKKNIIFFFILSVFALDALGQKVAKRYTMVLNMVHHNPGEPVFHTRYTDPEYLKRLGYTGQIPKVFVECGLTYDDFKQNIVPERSAERLWIEREAADIQVQINNAEKAHMPLYPFTDVLVVPKSLMDKYKDSMSVNGQLSILRTQTQRIVRAQIAEIFKRFPRLSGLTIRHGETYLYDTPFHTGNTPARTPEEHILLINILRDEICVKRHKVLIYRTWDFGHFHTQPDFYLKVTNAVKPHPLLYFSIKHTNDDFLRGVPFNKTIGLGKHQQIVEISTNQAGVYGKNSHPYYIGRGIIDGWAEMEDKKGLRSLYNDPKIKGFWIWTWGDGWAGPYFDNELWINLNEYVLRSFTQNPQQEEKDIFDKYAHDYLRLSNTDTEKFRELCLLSEGAVFYGQASRFFTANPWWCRDQYLTGIDLKQVVLKHIQPQVLNEKKENVQVWYRMEELSRSIHMKNREDQEFLEVSTTYGRIKYELIEIIWKLQIIASENTASQTTNKEELERLLNRYNEKWGEWVQLKRLHPCCPTLYVDYESVHCGPPFQESLKMLTNIVHH